MTFPYSRFTHFWAWHSLFKVHPFLGPSCFVGLVLLQINIPSFFLIWQNPQIWLSTHSWLQIIFITYPLLMRTLKPYNLINSPLQRSKDVKISSICISQLANTRDLYRYYTSSWLSKPLRSLQILFLFATTIQSTFGSSHHCSSSCNTKVFSMIKREIMQRELRYQLKSSM